MEFSGNYIERGPVGFLQDQRYLMGGPQDMTLEELEAYVEQVRRWRVIVEGQGRRLVTVAVLGGMALAYRPGGGSCRVVRTEPTYEGRPSAIDLAGEDIECDKHPKRHPVFLMLNFSCPVQVTWDNICFPLVVERLMLLEPDLVLLAPELHSWGVPLNTNKPQELATRWRRGLSKAVRAMRDYQLHSPRPIMAGIPQTIVILPLQGQL